jgi:regulator of sigma E protease
MNILITLIAFVVVFSLLILIHELGHFWAAKRAGIRVEEFGFGLPPRAFGKKIGETIYSVNWLPFGGFVRLYGEDSHDPGALKSRHSFAGKSLRQRITVVVAGVVMNFILAILLLTAGFSLGIQPLLVGPSDVAAALDHGQMQIQSGVVVKEVVKDSLAQKIGFQAGDIVVQLQNKSVFDDSFLKLFQQPPKDGLTVRVRRDKTFFDLRVMPHEGSLGLFFYDHFFLSRMTLNKLTPDGELARAGLQVGDVILKINGRHIYSVSGYQEALSSGKKLQFTVLRNFREMQFDVVFANRHGAVIRDVVSGGPADGVGLKKDDRIVQVDHVDVVSPEDAVAKIHAHGAGDLSILVERGGQLMNFSLKLNQDKLVGVYLAPLIYDLAGADIYENVFPTSVLKIDNVRYSLGESFVQSFRESYRLMKATLVMFVDVIRDVFTSFTVPVGVSGPVGIAQMTGVYVQEGFLSVIRFMALLSLSLAVMNLLPFPGLDGGRLLFLIIEGIRGKRVRQNVEQVIHLVGFVFLIVLILLVTYKDFVRVFSA